MNRPFLKRSQKEKFLRQHGIVIWLTGLPGSGKTTLAFVVAEKLTENGYFCQILDGNMLRNGINRDLGFSLDDRAENIRRAAEISKILINNGIIALCSFISPTNKIRNIAKEIIGPNDFIEIYISTPIEVCEARDHNGLYKKARLGEIQDFSGISSVYEKPDHPDLVIDTSNSSIESDSQRIIDFILPLVRLK
jgi:adenylylsulfate kinase